jgi:L-alanine-DL-glutamate epimerase-like enolase superfamily enzyme
MRVERLRCYSIDLPLSTGSYTMSHGRRLTRIETTVVEVVSDSGVVGYGEACTLGANYIEGFAASAQAAVRELAPLVVGSDPFENDLILDRMDAALRGHLPGKAAIDAALWDLRGKLLDLPVYKLLGGCHQPDYGVFHPLTLASPEAMADEATRMATQGYRCWQLKLGEEPLEDAARVRAVLDAVRGHADFVTSDANRGWTMAQALRFLAAIEGCNTYVEQPCRTMAELAEVRMRTSFPITIDELVCDIADLLDCLRRRAADAINIKAARVGGLTKAARLRDVAQAAGLMIMIDEPMGGDLATAGISHLAASCRPDNFLAASHVTATHLTAATHRPIARSGGAILKDGRASAPAAPGLGVDVDPEALGESLFEVAGR